MLAYPEVNSKKITTRILKEKKKRGEPITMITAYDYQAALALEQAGIDAILVGDSLGMVVLGYENTLPVTMEDMIHHCRAVARGASTPHLIGDMPFMSYQVSVSEAIRNAGRFLQEGGMDSVKLEGGAERAGAIRAIVSAGIPVMGHIGLLPQSVNLLGGWKAQGKSLASAKQLVDDAQILQDAGCYAIVLEVIPERVAELIAGRLEIPAIGIGAGRGCDGQVLVLHDLLGMFDRSVPRFVKKYSNLYDQMTQAFREYKADVTERRFPAAEHTHQIDDDAFRELLEALEGQK